jgi:hypothetical protein
MRAPFLPLRQGTSSGRINSRIGAPAGRVFLIDGSRLRLARRLPERGNAIKFSQNRYPHAEAARAPTFLDDERWTTLASFRFRCSLLPCFRINLRISRFRRPMCIPRSLDIDGRNRKRCVILAVQHPFSLDGLRSISLRKARANRYRLNVPGDSLLSARRPGI